MSLSFNVYCPADKRVAGCVSPEGAAALCVHYGNGSRIRHQGRIVWHEGFEKFTARGCYGQVAELIYKRIHERAIADYDKSNGPGAAAAFLAKREAEEKVQS